MSFDVLGRSADTSFRVNNWWWRPLWDYVCALAPEVIDERAAEAGQYNDGFFITQEQAQALAVKLRRELEEGRVATYAMERQTRLDAMPDEPCKICDGTGIRPNGREEFGDAWFLSCHGCNGCDGKKLKRPTVTWYGFDVDTVQQFAEFCEKSEGFEIH